MSFSVVSAHRTESASGELSPAQEALWIHERVHPKSAAYNCPFLLLLQGSLNVCALECALDEVVRRHESLRTVFAESADGPRQRVVPATATRIPYYDFRAVDSPRVLIVRSVEQLAREAFDLQRGPLFKTACFSESSSVHLLYLGFHHIVSDHWSMEIFLHEMRRLYSRITQGLPSDLADPTRSYIQYAEIQRYRVESGAMVAAVARCKARLEHVRDIELVPDRPPPPVPTFRGDSLSFKLSRDLTQRLNGLAVSENATLFMVMLAAYQTLLTLQTGSERFAVGVPIANRGEPGFERTLGFFANTLVLASPRASDATFIEVLRQTRGAVLDAFADQDVPLELLVSELRYGSGRHRSPLFQVMFVYLHGLEDAGDPTEVRLSQVPLRSRTSKFELTLSLVEADGELSGVWEYDIDRFKPSTIACLAEHFVDLLGAIVDSPLSLVDEFRLSGMAGAHGRTSTQPIDQSRFEGLAALFNERVRMAPDAIALVADTESDEWGPRHLTALAVDYAASALANELRSCGVAAGTVVGVHAPRSPEAVVAIVAVLKANGVFLALDPGHPPERLGLVLEDARVNVVLEARGTPVPVTLAHLRRVPIEVHGSSVREDASVATAPELPEQGAYVVYTSGSTGRPKGVIATQLGTVNRFRWMWRTFPFAPNEVCCQRTPLTFVDSIWEILGPLLGGAKGLIVRADTALQPEAFLDTLEAHQVTRVLLVPPLLQSLLEANPGRALPSCIRLWVISGEALPAALSRRFRARCEPEAVLLNLYGSSEVSADVTYYVDSGLADSGTVPIGVPIDESRVTVLDGRFRPMPQTGVGALFVAGAGLARGYLGAPDLTAERFLPDPLSRWPFLTAAGARIYRTGDKGRLSASGQIEYLGREDQQMKLNGCRIEPSEIVAALLRSPAIARAAVVLIDTDTALPKLVAYLVASAEHSEAVDGATIAPSGLEHELRQALLRTLPQYMVPSQFVLVPELPQTSSGKVNRTALAAIGVPAPAALSSRDPSPLERQLIDLINEACESTSVDLETRVLAVGNSLALVRLSQALNRLFPNRVTVQDLFNNPTVRELALRIESPTDPTEDTDESPEIVEI